MANTYVKIASVTVGAGGAANMQFTSIPATYDDLIIHFSARTNQAVQVNTAIYGSFNGSTANFSTGRFLQGDGSTAVSGTENRFMGYSNAAGATASTFSSGMIYIPNYAGSTNKSFMNDSVTETNGTTSYQFMFAGLWSQTAAITSITLTPAVASDFVQHTTAVLYGIKKS